MWILNNSKDLLVYIQTRSLSSTIKALDFSTLYTTIPHLKLKARLRELVQLCFIKKEWPTQIQIPCHRKGQISFCKKKHSTKKFSESDIIKMLECLIDNIFVTFGGRIFQPDIWEQTVLLFSPTCSLIVRGKLHAGPSQEKQIETSPFL